MARPKKIVSQVEIPELTEMQILQKQVEVLTQQLKNMIPNKARDSAPTNMKEFDDLEDSNSTKVSGDDYIKVISLCPYYLNLSTQSKGRGKLYTFSKFGEVKRIIYRDLIEIIENHSNFLNDGLFLIMNRDVIRRHGLDDLYEKLLTKEKIETILEGNQSDAVNMFRAANPKQQDLICNMIISEMADGKEMDLNFLDRISRVVATRIDKYDIVEKVEDTKNLRKILADKTVS
jgi:hypothetical protein